MSNPKRIILLGSTGSIGLSTLEVCAHLPEDLKVVAIAGGKNAQKLAEQARRYRVQAVACADAAHHALLREQCPGISVYSGPEGAREMVLRTEADMVVAAITGAAGLPATLAALESGKGVALANKEALVMCGAILTRLARDKNLPLLPVDSEHSAIFQCLQAGKPDEVRSITLTASGGPFLRTPLADFPSLTVAQALNHPTWKMGDKITIDSATMANKALEVIEARWLFGLQASQIQVVIHPQSIVHSTVEFVDRSVIAQLGEPDMKIPIQYALTHPARRPCPAPRLDLAKAGKLEFFEVDPRRFPAVELGYRCAQAGGTLGAAFNAANEVAVAKFLAGEIAFPEITALSRRVMDRHHTIESPTLQDVLNADVWARKEAELCLIS